MERKNKERKGMEQMHAGCKSTKTAVISARYDCARTKKKENRKKQRCLFRSWI